MLKWKKKEYEIIEGLYCDATDYDFYEMTIKDMFIGFMIGFFAGFLAMYLFFGFLIISAIIGIPAGFFGIHIYKNKIIAKNKRTLLLQFRDLLDSLNNSMSAGDNVRDSFSNSLEDMKAQHGETSYIFEEVNIIVMGMHNNINIEDLLENFAQRSHLDDVQDFCNTFCTCLRLGGNLKMIVNDCKEIISQKINIELEIETIVSGNKNQLNILIIMPFVLIGLMSMMGFKEVMTMDPVTVIVKVIALVAFGFSYVLGQKIVDIKV